MKVSAVDLYKQRVQKQNKLTNPMQQEIAFQGMPKIKKVPAKKLALALAAGLAITTPSLQSCASIPIEQTEQADSVNENPKKNLFDTISDKIYEKNVEENNERDYKYYISNDIVFKFKDVQWPAEQHKSFDLSQNKVIKNQIDKNEHRNISAALHADEYLLEYFAKNPDKTALPKVSEAIANSHYEYIEYEEKDINKIFESYRKVAKKLSISEREVVWNMPSFRRELIIKDISQFENDYKKENGYYAENNDTNVKAAYNSIKSENLDFFEGIEEDTKFKILEEMYARTVNTKIYEDLRAQKDYEIYDNFGVYQLNDFIETEEKVAAYKESIIQEKLAQAENEAHIEAKKLATEKASEIAKKNAYDKAYKLAMAKSFILGMQKADEDALEKAKALATAEAEAIAREKVKPIAEKIGRVVVTTVEATKTVEIVGDYTFTATEKAEGTASATVTTKQIEDRPTKDITETVTVVEEMTASDDVSMPSAPMTATVAYTYKYVPQAILDKKAKVDYNNSQINSLNSQISKTNKSINTEDFSLSLTQTSLNLNISLLKSKNDSIINNLNSIKNNETYIRTSKSEETREFFRRRNLEYQNEILSLQLDIAKLEYEIENAKLEILKHQENIRKYNNTIRDLQSQIIVYERENASLLEIINEEIVVD